MLRLFTLGELRLETESGRPLSRRRKPLILLAYLARHAPRRLARVELATLLWGERTEARSRHSLRQALLELHRSLGDDLVITPDSAQLTVGGVDLDVTCFERDVDAGRYREAVARWSGEFLDGGEDRAESALRTWIESERAGLRRRLTIACERLLDDAEQRSASREAIAIARRWMELAPLDEAACRRLVLALRRDGRATEALVAHSRFVARLREQLELAPSREFVRLGQSLDEAAHVERRHGDARERRAALPFVGRDAPFAALRAAWRDRATRDGPVVIEAARGMGTTRMCDELLRVLRDAEPSLLTLSCHGDPLPGPPDAWRGARTLFAALESTPALGGLEAGVLGDLALLLPALRRRFTGLAPAAAPPTSERLAASLAEALAAAAEDAPLIVVADRGALEDEESRRVLLRTAMLARGDLLFVIATESLADVTGEAARPPVVVRLEPLSVADVCGLLDGASRLAGDDRDSIAILLHDDTEGIPGYLVPSIEQLIDERLLAPPGARRAGAVSALDRRVLPVPERVRSWLRERLDVLDADAVAAAEAAAVLGSPSTAAQIGQVAGLSDPARARALDSLVRAGLLRFHETHGTVAFTPPMAQRTMYALIPHRRRETLHACAEAALATPSRWPQPRAARDRVEYHRSRAGEVVRARRGIGARAMYAAILVLLVAAGLAIWRSTSPAGPRSQTVAIFPFAVSGGARMDFLRAGMTDLLSTSLDGAAGLHTIDPRVVIAAAGGGGSTTAEPLTPPRARDVATRLGASYFVLGTVVSAGGRLQASAILYDTRGEDPVARASAEGAEGNLFDLVDRLTAVLAVGQGAGTGSGERLTRLAAATTSSLEALKAYLEARSEYRANDLFAAMASYQHAVAADSSFALAWYGLASTASWMMRPYIERMAIAQAVRQAGRLSPRERTLIDGFAAFSRGSADTAEQLATSLTQSYDDIEAWVLLGEVLYHHNWKRGRSLVESRHAWERVLALDSTYWPALQHLAEVAAIDGRTAEADSLLGRYERSVGTAHTLLASRAMRAFAFGDAASRNAITPQLADDRGFWLTLSVWYVSVLGRDVDGARALARYLVDARRPTEQRGFGHVLLAHLAAARGRWREARAELRIGREQTPVDALEYELLLALAPFRSVDTAAVRATAAVLAHTSPRPADASAAMSWPHTQGALRPLTRAYLTGLAATRCGDDAARTHAVATLSDLPDPTGPANLAQGFALSIRAERELARHHTGAALVLLERAARSTPFVAAWTSGFVSQGRERYLRAELLHTLARDDEALQWYGTFAENSPYDLVYLAPSLYRQGQIYEARGDRARATDRYGRFLALWKDSDPEFRAMTDEARRHIALLARGQ